MRDPQRLGQWWEQALPADAGASSTHWLLRLRLIGAINQSLPQWCNEAWIRQIRVANLRDDVVVIYSSSATALVPLRHRSQAFLRWLNERHQLGCTRLQLSVRPG